MSQRNTLGIAETPQMGLETTRNYSGSCVEQAITAVYYNYRFDIGV